MDLIQNLKSLDWEQESYPAYEDFLILALLSLLFPTVRFFLDRFVFEVPNYVDFELEMCCLFCFYDFDPFFEVSDHPRAVFVISC